MTPIIGGIIGGAIGAVVCWLLNSFHYRWRKAVYEWGVLHGIMYARNGDSLDTPYGNAKDFAERMEINR